MSKLNNMVGLWSATAVVWAAVVISGWFWLQASLSARSSNTAPAAPALKVPDIAGTEVLARLLGSKSATQVGLDSGLALADRFILSGVIASRGGQGAALIAVDGKPPKPFKVGATVSPGYVLVSVAAREAMLAEQLNAPVRLTLTMPLQGTAQSLGALQTPALSAPNIAPLPTGPVSGVSGASGVSDASGGLPQSQPNVAEETPAVPARADARRQPQALPSLSSSPRR